MKGRWFNIAFINCYASTEDKDNNTKNEFYSQLDIIYDSLPNNMIKVILGDLNAKFGRKQCFRPIIGNESLQNRSNDNGKNLYHSQMIKDKMRSNRNCQHKNIHKYKWMSP